MRARRAARRRAARSAALGAFGRRIGLAFQLLDDVLDVSGPAERTGKPRGTDLLDGTVTLPLILARERDPALRSARPAGDRRRRRRPRRCATASPRPARSTSRARRALAMVAEAKSALPRRLRRAAARRRWSWSPTASSSATPEPGGPRSPRARCARRERGDEALDLLLHVRLHEALQVADQRLGAAVELLVEALDDVLLEDAGAGPLAVGAAKRDLPVRGARLLPLGGVHELGVAVRADVQVGGLLAAQRCERGEVLLLEVDDLDRLAGGQDHAANVVA